MDTKIENIGGASAVLSILLELKVRELINSRYPVHANWRGIDKGFIVCVWISYIISASDHRLSALEDWVKEHELSLSLQLGESIHVKDFTDDRLGKILDNFSDEGKWNKFEIASNQQFIQVYDIKGRTIQLDATIGQSFGKIVEDGLLQRGYSKQFRKDLGQFKTMLANLGEENIPLASITVSGEKSDDELYVPIIKLGKESLPGTGYLWQGDKKMSAIETRFYVESIGDYYLSPLSAVQVPKSVLTESYLKDYIQGQQALVTVSREVKDVTKEIAKGFEKSVTKVHNGQIWTERHLVVRSEQYAISEENSLRNKLEKATKALEDLNKRAKGKKVIKTQEALEGIVGDILKKYDVTNLVKVEYQTTYQTKEIRASKSKEARTETLFDYSIGLVVNEEALKTRILTLGWVVYATNMPLELLSIEKAVLLYRQEYKIEHRFHNFKDEVTRLLPIFLKKDNRIVGLINLLLFVLKIAAAMEFKVQKKLEEKGEQLEGLYDGNPKIATPNPTISKMMKAMNSIAIAYIIQEGKIVFSFMNPVKPVQAKIMELLDINLDSFINNKTIPKNKIVFFSQ